MRRIPVTAGPIAVLCTAAMAPAGTAYVPVSQSRYISIEASVTAGEASDTASAYDEASGFSEFSSAVDGYASLGDPNHPRGAGGNASQYSAFLPDSIVALGFASTFSDPNHPFYVAAFSESGFDAEFDVASPTAFELVGSVASSGAGDGYASVSIFGPTGTLLDLVSAGRDDPYMLTGTLAPGSYTIAVLAGSETSAAGRSSTAGFEMTLRFVPEPATAAPLLIGWLVLSGFRRRHRGAIHAVIK